MSRSCQSATFSSAGITCAAHQPGEAGQVLAQPRVALVRHRRAALLAARRTARRPRRPRYAADGGSRSRGARCRWRPRRAWRRTRRAGRAGSPGSRSAPASARAAAATSASTAGSTLAKVPTAPEIAQVAISARACSQAPPVARELGVEAGELQAEGGRLGVDAVRAADAGRALCSQRPPLQRREQRVEVGEQQVGGLASAAGEARCRAGRTRSCRGADSAPRRRSPPRRGSGTRSRRGGWSPRSPRSARGR